MDSDAKVDATVPPFAAFCWGAASGIVVALAWVSYACITRGNLAIAPLLVGAAVGFTMQRARSRASRGHAIFAVLLTAVLVVIGNLAINQLVPYFEARDVLGWNFGGELGDYVLEEVRKDLASERSFMDVFDLLWLVGGCVLAGALAIWPGEK